ncbi:MAG: GNAT family N-acetyltransferase [Phycisphaerales bacterium]|nr:GNAT family N-acetyltransferase [Phycisphaerales bacterium]
MTASKSSQGSRRGVLQLGDLGYLRRPRSGDEAAYCRLRRRSGRFLSRWEPRRPGVEFGSGEDFARLLRSARSSRCERMLLFRLVDDALVGQVGLQMIERGPFQNATLGYWIGKPHARKGWGRELLTLAMRRAFVDLELERLEANIVSNNRASIALVESLGFRNEGYSTNYLEIDGRRRDHERWAILRTEWSRKSS